MEKQIPIKSISNLEFDTDKYVDIQATQILDRMSKFLGKLYLEVDGNLLKDSTFATILPNYSPDTKKKVFMQLKDNLEILYCVNSKDIVENRKIADRYLNFFDYVEHSLAVIENNLGVRPVVVITEIDVYSMFDLVVNFERNFQKKNYRVFETYVKSEQLDDVDLLVSENGFLADDHIPLNNTLILVTGATNDTKKLLTCLGQMYLDYQIDIKSGYAKFETLPLRNQDLSHPINVLYNEYLQQNDNKLLLDTFHMDVYGNKTLIRSSNLDQFTSIINIIKKISNHKNYMIKYKSPTDIIINSSPFCMKSN